MLEEYEINQLYSDHVHVLRHYDQLPPLHIPAAAAEPVFQILPDMAILANDHELGHSSSVSSSYADSPSSNSSTTYGTQSSTFMQRSISCHSLLNSPSAYTIEPENSHDSHQGMQHYNNNSMWSNRQWASESVFESMNRATPYNAEEKKERIERYRSKRNLRNFNQKIKYECRKTLADSRPRVRGRFARNDEMEKASPFLDEGDYSWTDILDALNKSDASIFPFR